MVIFIPKTHLKGTIERRYSEYLCGFTQSVCGCQWRKTILQNIIFDVTAPKGGTCKQVKAFESHTYIYFWSMKGFARFVASLFFLELRSANHKIWIRLRTDAISLDRNGLNSIESLNFSSQKKHMEIVKKVIYILRRSIYFVKESCIIFLLDENYRNVFWIAI